VFIDDRGIVVESSWLRDINDKVPQFASGSAEVMVGIEL
jgi:hypothetical protein